MTYKVLPITSTVSESLVQIGLAEFEEEEKKERRRRTFFLTNRERIKLKIVF